MAGKFDYKKVMEWLGFILRCPICGYKYNLDQTRVIDSEQNDGKGQAKILIHSDCNKCKSSVMFNVEINGPEVFSVGMITDLTSADSRKFQNFKPLEANDILNLHLGLKKFKGNLVELLAKKN